MQAADFAYQPVIECGHRGTHDRGRPRALLNLRLHYGKLLKYHGTLKQLHEIQMTFDDLIRYKALNVKYIASGTNILDLVERGSPGITAEIPMKNVCAMITQQLFDDLTGTCALLDISKRVFIEAAIIEALKKTQSIMDAEGLEDYLVERTQQRADSQKED